MEKISAYKEAGVELTADHVVEKYSLLVKKIAYHLLSRLPSSVQLDDLIQSGIIGLLEAAQRYDANSDASFETFASLRIRGAMLDDLRKLSWMPRSTHQNMRKISQAVRAIENRTNSPAAAKDIATELGVSMDEYYQMASTIYANEFVSFDNFAEETVVSTEMSSRPSEQIEQENLCHHISDIIKNFPEREQMILSLYYTEKLTFKEIGTVLGVSEARISQLHGQVLARLNTRMKTEFE